LGDEYVYSDSLHWHRGWKDDPTNDKVIMESMWKMLDEADVVIAHNGDRFDVPTLNGRFLLHGMKPPSSFVTIDTLKIARRRFKLTSNKLDFLANYLGLGKKVETGGFELWRAIIEDKCTKSFNKMVEYCEHDTWLLEQVYLKLAPWDNKSPVMYLSEVDDKPLCNICGSDKLHKKGFYRTKTQIFQKYQCQCGHNQRSPVGLMDSDTRKNVMRSI